MLQHHFRKYRNIYILMGILLFAIGVRIIRYCQCDQLERDTFNYLNMAESWASSGNILSAYMKSIDGDTSVPPLLPAVMTAGEVCGIGGIGAGLAFNILSGALICLALYWACIAVFQNRHYALVAAFLGAIHPYSLRLSALIMRDTPFMAAFMLAIACGLWGAKTKKMYYWVLFAVFTVLASLSRKEGPELIIIFFVWSIWHLWSNRLEWKRETIYLAKTSSCIVMIFLVCTLPLQLYLKHNSDCTWSIFNEDRLVDEYRKITKGNMEKQLDEGLKRID